MILSIYNFDNKNILFSLNHNSVPSYVQQVARTMSDRVIEFHTGYHDMHFVAKSRMHSDYGWTGGGIKNLVLNSKQNHYILTNDCNINNGVLYDICPNEAEPFFPIIQFDPKMVDNKTLFEYIYAHQTLGWKP